MTEHYPRTYRLLRNGHGAAKALEILIDASRGDAWALRWMTMLHSCARIGRDG